MRLNQFIFDRCVEASSMVVPLGLIVFIVVLYLTWLYTRRKGLSRVKLIIIYLLSILLISPLLIIGGLVFGLFNCSAKAFWDAGRPAVDLYKEVKKHKICPKNESDLARISESLYKEVQKNAKTKGYCDPKTNNFVWIVRPSLYYVLIFTHESTGVVYRAPSLLYPTHWNNIPDYSLDEKLLP